MNGELVEKLSQYGIENYIINNDGTIDVLGDVRLEMNNLEKIPFKFGKVSGSFVCHMNKLTTLDGCPTEVGHIFNCCKNELTSLENGPVEVGYNYLCCDNKLSSLNTLVNIERGDLYCWGNEIDRNSDGFMGFCGGKIRYVKK